jgi:FtsH-binding integral membrane protein
MNFTQEQAQNHAIGRSDFMSKVMALFGLSILSTGFGVYFGFHSFSFLFQTVPGLIYAIFAVELLLIFTSRMWSKTVPLNYFLFTFFTFISGVTIVPLIASFAAEFGGYDIIYRALFSTTVMFAAAAAFGLTTQRSLSGMRGFLITSLIGIIVVSILGFFFPWGNQMEMIFSGFGVILFSAFTAYDINKLKHYPEDEYISAAIALYLDIFNLFIFILRLTGALSRD